MAWLVAMGDWAGVMAMLTTFMGFGLKGVKTSVITGGMDPWVKEQRSDR